MDADELKQALERLRADYANQLPASLAQMEELWQRLVADEVPMTELAKLVRMAHSICGSGTTFGLPRASKAACELEALLEPFLRQGRLPDAAGQAIVLGLLAELKRVASAS